MSVVLPSPRHSNTDRIPPRRRKRRKKVLRHIVWPALKYGVLASLVLTVGLVLCNKIIRPFRLCSIGGSETRRMENELRTLDAQNADLQRQINHLKTPDGIADAARKLGYVKPGEVTLVIPEGKR